VFFPSVLLDFQKRFKFAHMRNRTSNLGQRLLLKVSSNLGRRECISSTRHDPSIHKSLEGAINEFVYFKFIAKNSCKNL
jgi:hypothetical protein